MRNLFHLDKGKNFPREVRAVVEVSTGSKTKYEYDFAEGILRLDRILRSSARFPGNYGFVPQTLGNTVNPADVFIILPEPLYPCCVVDVRPLGLLEMADEMGVDSKLLAVLVGDPRMDGVEDISQVNKVILEEILHFFTTYKVLARVKGWSGREEAFAFLKEAHEEYLTRFGTKDHEQV